MGNLIKISVCVTVFNEKETTVRSLLTALKKQTLKPDEIILIDGKDYNNCSRSKGRNIAIKKARNKTIALTDAGCIPNKDWLEKITLRLCSGQVVAGSYKMIPNNNFQKAESIFLGVKQKDINSDFMPSTRSMALTKTIWKKAGGFPENLDGAGEDYLFNVNLLNAGAKFATAKTAIVDWQMPDSIKNFYLKIRNYACGDAQTGIWWHPIKKWQTHNLKILTIYFRYLVILLSFYVNPIIPVLLVILYLLFAYSKAGFWGILLQPISDFAVMFGFLRGILKRCVRI